METGTAINGWLAFVGVLAGGAFTKVIDRFFAVHETKIRSEDDRRKELITEEAGFRTELRLQIADLNKILQETRLQVGDLQTMVDEWRDKYYASIAASLALNTQYTELFRRHEELSKKHSSLESDMKELTRKVIESGVQL